MTSRLVAPLPITALLAASVTLPLLVGCGGDPPKKPRAPIGASQRGTGAQAEREFWTWFVDNEAFVVGIDADRERVSQAIGSRLERIHPDLTFEVGPRGVGPRELVFSASGNRTAFAAVHRLVTGAPPLPRWRLVELRPRRAPIQPVRIDDLEVRPEQVEFALFPEGGKVGVALFFDAEVLADPVTMKRIGYALLDQALGERDATMKVGTIDWRPKDARGALGRSTLPHLAAEVDALASGDR